MSTSGRVTCNPGGPSGRIVSSGGGSLRNDVLDREQAVQVVGDS